MEPVRIGIVGCGNISGIYLQNLARLPETQIVAVADLDEGRARKVAEAHGIRALSPEALLAGDDVELVLNLTVPKAHFGVAQVAVRNGKHVYSEKPISVELSDARRLLREADDAGVLVGCAPDTVLGAGIQTCRKLIDDGAIGEPVAGNAFMLCRGHESWHPSPEFYYEVGGGPMLDMGPYYVHAYLTLIGGVRRVTGMAKALFKERTITSQPKHGRQIVVETPTHITGTMEFDNGAIAHLTTSFDVFPNPLPSITIYGSEGTLIVPDPNTFGGEVWLRRGTSDYEQVPLTHPHGENARGLGVIDMARAIREGRTDHRASGAMALHALEVMGAFTRSSEVGRHIEIESRIQRPKAMPPAAGEA
jgi:predicted dehydrogenase